ncbi:hypothetical protein ZOSMA_140G00260 [Zostera marina]|uniref:Uncharacterized protein n=1 Tax=Zostera marina TaxID=29655 RepID=A0A0K9PXK9_ZOSMR|nr:hypothetical protein ZOSMA_140G00260 [Zostera marina]
MDVSTILGWSSLIAWSFAEIPQIMTNYVEKSVSGIHIYFLISWLVGDFFNICGCIIEPATLPTQLYMAILYTIGSCVLLGQKLYYDTIFSNRETHLNDPLIQNIDVDPELGGDSIPTGPILINSKDAYYMSARSLAVSPNPTPPNTFFFSLANSVQQDTDGENLNSTMDHVNSSTTSNQSRTIRGFVPAMSLMVYASVGLYSIVGTNHSSHESVNLTLVADEEKHSIVGTILGYAMAIAYVSGRLPQISLNNSKENHVGVNPCMFSLALFANTTYIASILFKSLEWSAISPNLPWIVDAVACILLDLYILVQLCFL